MAGSYDRRLARVLTTLTLVALVAVSASTQELGSGKVRLQLRVFEGGEDITPDAKLQLYPRGQRTGDIPMTLGPDQAFEAEVPTGFYDVQIVKERRGGQVGALRWIENILVQRYPDEAGRHLQVLNLNPQFGALQIRPATSDVASARGWSAVAVAPGDAAREVAKARSIGDDLLMVLPAGRYDIKVNLSDRTTTWIRDIDIPVERTRLKTWTKAATP
jgi:hypothetical protein